MIWDAIKPNCDVTVMKSERRWCKTEWIYTTVATSVSLKNIMRSSLIHETQKPAILQFPEKGQMAYETFVPERFISSSTQPIWDLLKLWSSRTLQTHSAKVKLHDDVIRAGVKYVFVFTNTNTNTNTAYLYFYLIKFQTVYLYLYLYLIHRIWCIWQIRFQIHFFPVPFSKHKLMEHKLTWIVLINMLKSVILFQNKCRGLSLLIPISARVLVIVLVHLIWLVSEYVTNH